MMLKELFASVGIFLASIFGGAEPNPVIAPSLNQPASAVVALSDAPDLSGPATSSGTTTIIDQYITQPVMEREVVAQNAVTREELDASLSALRTDLLSVIANSLPRVYAFSGPAATTPVSTATFSYSQKIDQLSGTSLSNITVNGVTGLTDADIPDGITASNYLPLTGGTVSGSLSFPYLTATSTTATSTFSGNLLVSGSLYQNNLQLASSRLSFRDLLFYDDFNRADTAIGQLGVSTSGHTYDMRGVSAQTGNAVTRIDDGRWVSNAGDVTYAIQTLSQNVTRMGGRISWTTGSGGASPATFAMLISPDKTGSNLYLNAGAHIVITRTSWSIQYIDNGTFVTVRSGTFSPALATDGTSYPFEITINGPVMYYSFAGVTGTASSPYFVTHAGPYATWEHYYGSSSVADLLRIEAVWAGTTPVSSGVLYDLGSSGYVGIGTSTPSAKLDIMTGASNTIASRNFLRFSTTLGAFIQQGLNANGDLAIDTVYGTAANLMTIKRSGFVGIGTTSPQRLFNVEGSGPQIRLTNSTDGTTYAEFNDVSGGVFSISKTALTGPATIDLSPIMSDASNSGIVRLFRSSSSTAQSQFQIFKGNGTASINTILSSNSNSYINALGGNVGIATTTPWRTLSVTGTVGLDGLTGSTGAGSLCLTANREVVYNSASDACLPSLRDTKHDISSLSVNALEIVDALDPVSFIYNDGDGRVRYGFIAEDTVAVDPHLVTYSASGTLSGIDDRSIISVVVKAIQELMARVQGFTDRFTTNDLTFVRGEADVLSTRELTTDKLCIGSTCVTEDELQALLANAAMGTGVSGNGSDTPAPSSAGDPDTDPPVITINGNNPAYLSIGDTYSDLGATVTDNVDLNLSYQVFVGSTRIDQANIDTSEPNEWHVHYVATDNAGNTATSTRTVIVDSPTIAPTEEPVDETTQEPEEELIAF